MMKKLFIVFILIFFNSVFSQDQTSPITIKGDSLKGKLVSGENIREVIGNVIIIQDDIKITCSKAIQYLAKNSALLIGNVVLTQDSVVIKTERGKYFGDLKIATSDTNVYLKNESINLFANSGKYNLNTKIAEFIGEVVFYDSVTNLKSIKLNYEKENEKIIAVGNVTVSDSLSEIKADSLIHLRNTKLTKGFGNIVIFNKDNNVTISGKELLDDKNSGVSKIFGKPFLTQIEELSNGTFDTLFIQSEYMEANKDSSSKLFAIDSVRIVRGDFLSNNDYTIYDKADEKITIIKQKEKRTPVLWYENTQVTGDSIYINLDSSKIKSVDIFHNSILISKDSLYNYRFNQMSGDTTKLIFRDGNLAETNVYGNVLSIYYLFEEDKPNGLLKSSARNIKILFDENKVTDVKMYGSPISEFHPENLVKGNEKGFTLPTFIIYEDKPNRNKFKKMYNKISIDQI